MTYDATRQACGPRPTFAPYGGLRRRRNEVEYPAHPGEQVDLAEATDAVTTASQIIDAATKLIPHLGLFTN